MALSFFVALIVVCAIGGAYTLVGYAILRRSGRARLVAWWLATSACLGALGTLRSLALQREAGMDVTRVIIPGFCAAFIIAMLLILAVPTAALARSAARGAMEISTPRLFLSGVASTLGGIVFALAVAIVLDVARIRYIPIR
jgi:hypothetical protein